MRPASTPEPQERRSLPYLYQSGAKPVCAVKCAMASAGGSCAHTRLGMQPTHDHTSLRKHACWQAHPPAWDRPTPAEPTSREIGVATLARYGFGVPVAADRFRRRLGRRECSVGAALAHLMPTGCTGMTTHRHVVIRRLLTAWFPLALGDRARLRPWRGIGSGTHAPALLAWAHGRRRCVGSVLLLCRFCSAIGLAYSCQSISHRSFRNHPLPMKPRRLRLS